MPHTGLAMSQNNPAPSCETTLTDITMTEKERFLFRGSGGGGGGGGISAMSMNIDKLKITDVCASCRTSLCVSFS